MIKMSKKSHGYAILELLFYIALFSVLSLVVIDAMIIMTRSFRETAVQAELAQGGVIMERISREIRAAYDINSISANNLKLNTKDDTGANSTVEFLLSGSNLQFFENNILLGNLNPPNMMVSGLTFGLITTTEGKAVKIILTVESTNDIHGRLIDFYDTIVLRGIY